MVGRPEGQDRSGRSRSIAIGGARAHAHARPGWLGPLWDRFAAWVARSAWLEVDRRRLFLWLPVLYGIGIVLYFSAEREPSVLASFLPMCAALAAALLGRARLAVLAPALAMAALFGGFLVATLRTHNVTMPVLVAPVSANIAGTIESMERTNYGARLVVAVRAMEPAQEHTPRRIRVTYRGKTELNSGEGVRFKARLTPPSPPAVPGGFDFQREAFYQQLGAVGLVTGVITSAPDIRSVGWVAEFRETIDRARNGLTSRIVAVIGGSTGAIAAALVTGKRGEIAEKDNDAWRAAGIYHIISISGLHMMLAAGLFFWSARVVLAAIPGFSRLASAKKCAAVVAMAGAFAYDVFSGNDVATERSLIMTLVMLGAVLVDRPALAMRNLAISGLIVLTMRPEAILGPSFQMSFSAVAGLVAYGEFMRQWREKRAVAGRTPDQGLTSRAGWLAIDFSATSLIAGLATASFQAFHFARLNPYGLLGNSLAIPICSFIVMPMALLGVVLYPLGLDAPAWWLMGQGIALISTSAALVADISGSVATTGRFSAIALCLLALGTAMLTIMTTLPFRLIAALLLCLGLLRAGTAQQPNLILDASGRTALVRNEQGTLTFVGKSRPIFALQQWLPGDRDARLPRDPTLTAGTRCDRLGCTARMHDSRYVAVVLDPTAFAEDCERAAIIVTPLVAPKNCHSTAELYDRSYFTEYGATYIYPRNAGQLLETARNARQQRPWIPRAPHSITTNTPSASTDVPSAPVWDPQAPDNLEALPPQ